MHRAYLSLNASEATNGSENDLYGQLASKLPFAVEQAQKAAWIYQIRHLRQLAAELPDASFFFEFLIPRMGRRADLIVIQGSLIFVIEYKVGASCFDRSSIDQVFGYGLDLKHFHETSHDKGIVPILVATEATGAEDCPLTWSDDGLAQPLLVNADELSGAIHHVTRIWGEGDAIEANDWIAGRYKPTPTIVEAAQALYRGHAVEEISRSEAGAENLTTTVDYVAAAIEVAKHNRKKIICFITGVPGSGKTLAGLNLATARQRAHSDEHAVFLSGNGPLVDVLREALAADACEKAREAGTKVKKVEEDRRAAAFIQNIHHFRDEALSSTLAPIEKVVVFDEAQRAWNVEQTSNFMQRKKGQLGFSMSEPEFLLSVMDRHDDWCAIVCLVGGGQEINTGEAGIEEWLRAVERSFQNWEVHLPASLKYDGQIVQRVNAPDLHLAASIRSFRAERLSDFIGHVISGEDALALAMRGKLSSYPLHVTRKLETARAWLRSKARGNERSGLLASSNAARLKPHGVFVKAKIEPARWFLTMGADVRSSNALEDAGTEFDVQGLELDWTCVCWDLNFRRDAGNWKAMQFKGTKWQSVSDTDRRQFIANSYRVLLTRGRQGMIVFVPEGSDEDGTRPPQEYDKVYSFLLRCGFDPI